MLGAVASKMVQKKLGSITPNDPAPANTGAPEAPVSPEPTLVKTPEPTSSSGPSGTDQTPISRTLSRIRDQKRPELYGETDTDTSSRTSAPEPLQVNATATPETPKPLVPSVQSQGAAPGIETPESQISMAPDDQGVAPPTPEQMANLDRVREIVQGNIEGASESYNAAMEDFMQELPQPVALQVQDAMSLMPEGIRNSDMAPYYEQAIGRAMILAAQRGGQNITLAGQAAAIAATENLATLEQMNQNGTLAYGQQYLASITQRQAAFSEEVKGIYSTQGLKADQQQNAVNMARERYMDDLDLLASYYEQSSVWDDTWWPGRALSPDSVEGYTEPRWREQGYQPPPDPETETREKAYKDALSGWQEEYQKRDGFALSSWLKKNTMPSRASFGLN